MPRTRGALAGAIVAVAACLGCDHRPSEALDAAFVARNLASFDQVWTTVRDRHWDPTLGGLDWQAVRDELRPKVERSRSAGEARAVMEQAVGRLRQSHFGIIPAEEYDELPGSGAEDAASEGAPGDGGKGTGSAGVSVRMVEGTPVVFRVLPGGPADRAGVRPGWSVVAVGGERLAGRLARVGRSLGETPWRRTLQGLAAEARLGGSPGDRRRVRFDAGGGRDLDTELVLEPPAGTAARLGWLPVQYLRFDRRDLPGRGGYVGFNVFLDPPTLMPAFEAAVRDFRSSPGIVLDLRGNIGGLGLMATGIAGWFVTDRDRELGTMQTREGKLRFVVHPRAETYGGPLAVLVDEMSISTAEILAAGLQDLGRAKVFGVTSAGAALPSAIERLPNGDGFQYAFADYVRASGERLEGRGVVPDVEAPLTRAALLAGRDPALEAALDWIRDAGP